MAEERELKPNPDDTTSFFWIARRRAAELHDRKAIEKRHRKELRELQKRHQAELNRLEKWEKTQGSGERATTTKA